MLSVIARKLSAEGFEVRLKRVEEKLQNIKSDIDFRTIKSEIEMRPFFLSSETSVIGYVFICALAYQIRSVLKFHMKKCNSQMSMTDALEILKGS